MDTLTYDRFDPRRHGCDCCGRTLKDGAVILSDGRAYGRACAATALGRPKNDRGVIERIDALRLIALRVLWASTLADTGKWRELRFDVPALPREQGGPGGTRRTPYLEAAGSTWLVYELPDGRIIGTAPRSAFGRKINTRIPTLPALCAGPLDAVYYEITGDVLDAVTMWRAA